MTHRTRRQQSAFRRAAPGGGGGGGIHSMYIENQMIENGIAIKGTTAYVTAHVLKRRYTEHLADCTKP